MCVGEQRRSKEKGRERESQADFSAVSAEHDSGLELTNHEIMT